MLRTLNARMEQIATGRLFLLFTAVKIIVSIVSVLLIFIGLVVLIWKRSFRA